jgi:GNAT superfamily N-acetyltransferase
VLDSRRPDSIFAVDVATTAPSVTTSRLSTSKRSGPVKAGQVRRGAGGALDHPQWRRGGIARRLIHDLASTARREGHATITVIGNQHARKSHQAVEFGYAETALGLAPHLRLDLITSGAPAAWFSPPNWMKQPEHVGQRPRVRLLSIF